MGVSTCATSLATAGTHSITAIYSGDANLAGSTSWSVVQIVNQASTAVAVGAPVNPSVVGQAVTITATVTVSAPGAGTATGTVGFLDGGATIAGCGSLPLGGSGSAICVTSFPTAGAHPITAVYSGDADFDGSSSTALTQTVAQGSTTTTMLASSNGLMVAGYSVTFTARIAPASPASGLPTGTVEFMDGIAPISGCTAQPLAAGVARCSVVYGGPGVHAMSAAYSGDHDFAGSASPSFTMTVSLDPSVPDTGAHATPSVWGGLAVFGGFLLLCLGMLVCRRGRSAA